MLLLTWAGGICQSCCEAFAALPPHHATAGVAHAADDATDCCGVSITAPPAPAGAHFCGSGGDSPDELVSIAAINTEKPVSTDAYLPTGIPVVVGTVHDTHLLAHCRPPPAPQRLYLRLLHLLI